MSKKKKKSKQKQNHASEQQKIPMWGMLVAAVMALLMVNVGLVILDNLGVKNDMIRIIVVIILAVAAGLLARPLTIALQNRFRGKK
ncbi:MAG: hypothetical protein XD50_1372 [Clostridia bacterium 41_269]|nr:MAG: hypothetical protein XD50_1372 [Clostridia bacterium 41_269]